MEGKCLLKVGVIQTAFIGDAILTGLLVEGLFRAGHTIVFFTKSGPSAIFENDMRVSKVIVLKKLRGFRKLLAFRSMVRQVKNEKLDALLCPHRSFTTTLLAFFSRVNLRVGFQTATLASLYPIQRPYSKEKHECVRYLDLIPPELCSIELSQEIAKVGRPVLRYPDLMREPHSAAKQRPYFVVAIGTIWNTKKYTHAYFAQICKSILDEYPNLDCYLTGDKNDAPECRSFEAELSQYATRIINVAGKSTVKEFVSLVARARFIMANDSSPLHLAGSFNVPVIGFFGPTSSETGFGPTSDRHLVISHKTIFGSPLSCQPCGTHGAKRCPRKHHACMKMLGPVHVFPKIKSFLMQEIDFS